MKVLEKKVGQIVKEVDKYVEEMGLTDLVQFKTTKEKELYYWNYIDDSGKNIFKGVIELPSVYYIKLANLLCNSLERLQQFREDFYDADGNVSDQLRQFRRHLLDTRKDLQRYLEKIKYYIDNERWQNLHMELENFFLEPVEHWIIEKIVEMITNDGLTVEDIYQWQLQNYNLKAITTFDTNYVKELTKNTGNIGA